MMDDSSNLNAKRAQRAGDQFRYSGRSSEEASLQEIDTDQPDQVRLKKTEESDQSGSHKMQTVKADDASQKEKDANPDQKAKIEMDTGNVEIGYNKKKEQTVVSFTHGEQTRTDKEVIQNKAAKHRGYDKGEFESNDLKFLGGATSLSVGVKGTGKSLQKRLEHRDAGTTVERVAPFLNTRKEQQMRQKAGAQSKTATVLTRLISDKQQKKSMFSKQLKTALELVKEAAKKQDFSLYYGKRKWEEEETVQPPSKPKEQGKQGKAVTDPSPSNQTENK